ncbi:MAG TPA: hypothetical protein VFF73_21960 [Planctomycetota bacterium]|nr:hypothetical protein [Planctomycetota bacterium]
MKDPLEEALEKVGVHLEKRDVSPVTQMIAGGLGSIAGSFLGGRFLHLGTIGKALASLGGAVVGHVAVTYRVHFEPRKYVASPPPPESPMAVSDRR